MSQIVIQEIKEKYINAIESFHSLMGDDTVIIKREYWLEIAKYLKENPRTQMDHFIDLTAVDWLNKKEQRFEIILHVRSVKYGYRIRLKTCCSENDCEIDSLSSVWKGANWFERELWDMFGIKFNGHPNLKRILLYEEFEGHPLRKDYQKNKRQPLLPQHENAPQETEPFPQRFYGEVVK